MVIPRKAGPYGGTIVVFAILAVVIFGYATGKIAGAGTTEKSSITSMGKGSTSISKSIVERCISLCKDTMSVDNYAKNGACLSPDLNGYGCAVVVNAKGHCIRSFIGTPEIVLNNRCEYVGVYVHAK